jgi:hypothetical protein
MSVQGGQDIPSAVIYQRLHRLGWASIKRFEGVIGLALVQQDPRHANTGNPGERWVARTLGNGEGSTGAV